MPPCRRVGACPHWRGPGQRELHLRLRHSDGAQSGSWARVKGHGGVPGLHAGGAARVSLPLGMGGARLRGPPAVGHPSPAPLQAVGGPWYEWQQLHAIYISSPAVHRPARLPP